MFEKIFGDFAKIALDRRYFFSAFFDNNAKDVQYILRIILEKDDLKVLKVQTQKSFENNAVALQFSYA